MGLFTYRASDELAASIAKTLEIDASAIQKMLIVMESNMPIAVIVTDADGTSRYSLK